MAEIENEGLRRTLPPIEGYEGPFITLEGRRLLNLASNDYLGLAGRLSWEEVLPLVEGLPLGAGAARLLSGNHPLYARLEEELASLYGAPALVFSSGYAANLAVIGTLAGRRDLVLADRLVHASLIDGLRLSGATFYRYRHLDLDHLEDLLRRHRGRHRHVFLVTESVFSMDGDVPDLEGLVALKERYGAVLFVDEAHAVGVLGERGLGLAEARGLLSRVDLLLGTFGKALGGYGAFLVCPPEVRDFLVNRARPFIFTTALPPLVLAVSLAGLRRAVAARREREELAEKARALRQCLGLDARGLAGGVPIVPVVLGETERALAASRALREAGYHVPAIRPPTVPRGTARLRLSLTWPVDLSWLADLVRILEGFLSRAT